jgi:polyribonucleotide nucleotidyltransferase
VIVDALMFAHQSAQPLIDLQEKLRAAVGKPKREFVPPVKDPAIVEKVAALANQKIEAAMAIRDKHERYSALDSAGAETKAALAETFPIVAPRSARRSNRRRRSTCASWCSTPAGRIDGRAPSDIRTITCEVGVSAPDARIVAVHAW